MCSLDRISVTLLHFITQANACKSIDAVGVRIASHVILALGLNAQNIAYVTIFIFSFAFNYIKSQQQVGTEIKLRSQLI